MKHLIVLFAFILVASPAKAMPQLAPGAENLCIGYEETVEGVFLDASGFEMLRFRVGSSANGPACYAWLNTVASWNIGSVGSVIFPSHVRSGETRIMDNGRIKVTVDKAAGSAVYERNRRKTKGRLLP